VSSVQNQPNPYENFQYRLLDNGQTVAGFNHASGIDSFKGFTTKTSGIHTITLERGTSYSTDFVKWCFESWTPKVTQTNDNPLPAFTKTLTLGIFNEISQMVLSFTIKDAVPSHFRSLPNLNDSEDATLIESLTLVSDSIQQE
jgi:phage tail-like protein